MDDETKPTEETWEFVSGAWPETVYRKGTNKLVAEVWAEDGDDDASAELIAAAPEMYRMLEMVCEWMQGADEETQRVLIEEHIKPILARMKS